MWYYDHKSFWTYIIVDGELERPRNETCKNYYICSRTTFDSYNIAYYSVLGLAILIPTIAFLYCYFSIIFFVRRHMAVMSANNTIVNTDNNNGNENRAARNKRTLKLILALIFLNLLCRTPVWTFAVVTNLKETETNKLTLFLFYGFHLLSNLNSMVNPFVYAIFNDSIRSTRHSACGGGATITRDGDGSGLCGFFTRCCYNHIKTSSMDYFVERRGKNNYDFTKNSKFIPSVSTQKFNISDKNEFASPNISS